MEKFVQGQRLTASQLNSAFEKVGGPMNPSNDYQWTKTDYGNLQTTWDTFIQTLNQNPDTLEVGVGYSKIGSETVVEIDGKKPAALRRVFVNVGKLRERYDTFGRTFYECPNIGDTNGIPLIGIVGFSFQDTDGYYMTGDGKLHFSVWNPFLSQGDTPTEWLNGQKLWQNDVSRGSDSRGWWWSGITLESFTPEYVTTPQSPDAEGLDICCFPLYIHYSKPNAEWSSETYAVLCVMLKKDMPSIYALTDPQIESQFFAALQQAYPVS